MSGVNTPPVLTPKPPLAAATKKSKRKNKKWMLWVAIAALGLGGALLLRPKAPDLPNVSAVAAQLGEFRKTVTSAGTVKAEISRTLSFPGSTATTGVPNVREVAVRQGDSVKAGQYLARQDADSLQRDVEAARSGLRSAENDLQRAQQNRSELRRDLARQVDNARATLAGAQTALADAERNLKTQRDLNAVGVASLQDVRAAQNTRDDAQRKLEAAQRDLRFNLSKGDSSAQSVLGAEAALDSARVKVRNLEKTLADTKLYAPVSGVVTGLNITVGTPPPNNQPAIEITDPRQLYVEIQFDETRAADLRIGQSATVRFDALPRRTFKAVVSRVSPVARESGQVSAVLARVKLLETQGVRPGFTGIATVTTKRLAQAISVPLEATQENSQQVKVWRLTPKTQPDTTTGAPGEASAQEVKVNVLLRNASSAAVSGLKAGDLVMSPVPPEFASNPVPTVKYTLGQPVSGDSAP